MPKDDILRNPARNRPREPISTEPEWQRLNIKPIIRGGMPLPAGAGTTPVRTPVHARGQHVPVAATGPVQSRLQTEPIQLETDWDGDESTLNPNQPMLDNNDDVFASQGLPSMPSFGLPIPRITAEPDAKFTAPNPFPTHYPTVSISAQSQQNYYQQHVDEPESPPTYDFSADEAEGQETSGIPDIGGYILMIRGAFVLSGSKELVQSHTKAALYEEGNDITVADVVILKRVAVNVGVFLGE